MRLRGHAVQRRQLWAHHPATQTPTPGTPVGRAALPSAAGPAVDGQSRLANSLRSRAAPNWKGALLVLVSSCYPVAQDTAALQAELLISGWLHLFLPHPGPSRTLVRKNWQERRGDPRRESCCPCLYRMTAGPGGMAGSSWLSLYVAFAFHKSDIHRGRHCLVPENQCDMCQDMCVLVLSSAAFGIFL